MSLINKMLQDLDKRHAADGSGKTLVQQLRPVRTPMDWRRIMWEVGAGLLVGVGWAAWVLYQISPRSIVTDLAFQLQAKKAPTALGAKAPTLAGQVPPAVPPAAIAPAPAAPAAAPVLPAAPGGESTKVDMLKLATEIGTPFDEKAYGTKSRAERKSTPAAKAAREGKRETLASVEPVPGTTPSGAGAPSKVHAPVSIDKRVHPATPAERAENEFRKATGLLNQGRVAEAIDAYKATLQQDPGHAAARQALVGLLLEARRIDEAQQFLQEGLNLDPDRLAYAILLARIQVERGDLEGAHQLLRKHVGSAANNAEYYAFDAAVLQRLGRHKEAVAGYQAALRLAPRAGLWWMGMGISLQADNRAAEALDAYKRAKSAGGLSPDLLAFVDQRVKQLQ